MIPRFKPWLGKAEILALLRRNTGAVKKFEQCFAKRFGAVDAVAFPYGRSAQWAFFKAMGIEDAEIIMPAYTCSVVAHAVTLSGNHPIFIDIQLNDYNMNLSLVPDAINENTRAIIATHTFGYPQDIDKLEVIVKDAEARYGHKIWLMQDCCHAFGAKWNGRMVSTSGDIGVFAFNISKLMTSIFGGMLTFQDQTLADKVRKWRDAHFQKPRIWKAIKRRLYLLAVYVAFNEKIYGFTWWLQEKTPLLNSLTKSYHLDDKIHFPSNYLDHMMDVEAAVGLIQLNKYSHITSSRRNNAKWYAEHLPKKAGWVYPPIVEGATYSHYVIRVPNKQACVRNIAKKGVHLGELIQYSIPNLNCYQMQGGVKSQYVSTHTINLPVASFITKKKRDLIKAKIEIFDK